jgi:3-deoxy-D-manno-octulosonate 8-phosphate phosphatase (KDO 8-P phosphatase)
MDSFKQRLRRVACFVFDVDGVLTNGALTVASNGEFLRTMNIKDGYAIQLAVRQGYKVAVISGGHSSGIPDRMNRLGVTDVFMGVTDKQEVLETFLAENGIAAEAVLYMGDDVPDKKSMGLCGVAAAPADAVPEVRELCHFISSFGGGEGCVRDVIEQTLRLHGKWE